MAVDALVVKDGSILLVKRKEDPFRGFWALPGGYVDRGETMEEAVAREVREETGLEARPVKATGIYDEPGRDSRGNVSVAWLCRPRRSEPKAGSDAEEARFFGPEDLPRQMAFDHRKMIEDAMPTLRPVKVLAGGVFNLVHPGHVHFLREARRMGDELTVVVASDKTVLGRGKKLLFPARERASAIRSLRFVDKVVTGDDRDLMKVVRKERPEVIALGYDQDEKWLERSLEKAGMRCRIRRVGELKGYSTKTITGG